VSCKFAVLALKREGERAKTRHGTADRIGEIWSEHLANSGMLQRAKRPQAEQTNKRTNKQTNKQTFPEKQKGQPRRAHFSRAGTRARPCRAALGHPDTSPACGAVSQQ
jgi:hypothetical protein